MQDRVNGEQETDTVLNALRYPKGECLSSLLLNYE
jgi:hypothetical protein